MAGRRPQRLSEEIREEVSQIVSGELNDPRIGLVTVTDVKLSPDMHDASVFVHVTGDDEEVARSLAGLRAASRFVRWELGQTLRMRYTPQLHFIFDKSVRTAARIEEILKEEGEKSRVREVEGRIAAPLEPSITAIDAGSGEPGALD